MKILITGASGFVGQALQQYLSNEKFIISAASLRKVEDVNNIDFSDVDIYPYYLKMLDLCFDIF